MTRPTLLFVVAISGCDIIPIRGDRFSPAALAWEYEHGPAIKALVESCHPGGPLKDWGFDVGGNPRGNPPWPLLSSYGPWAWDDGLSPPAAEQVRQCIDKGLLHFPPYPDVDSNPKTGSLMVLRW